MKCKRSKHVSCLGVRFHSHNNKKLGIHGHVSELWLIMINPWLSLNNQIKNRLTAHGINKLNIYNWSVRTERRKLKCCYGRKNKGKKVRTRASKVSSKWQSLSGDEYPWKSKHILCYFCPVLRLMLDFLSAGSLEISLSDRFFTGFLWSTNALPPGQTSGGVNAGHFKEEREIVIIMC